MSSSAHWLISQLRGKREMKVIDVNCFEMYYDNKKMIIYCPTTDEYEITSAIIYKAKNTNAVILAYPHQWCRATSSAISLGKSLGIDVIPFGRFFDLYG